MDHSRVVSARERCRPIRERAVTLHDVAREAGVAVSTVSRALSNPERVSARTREHVQAVASGWTTGPTASPGAASGRTHAGAAGPRHHQPAQLRR